MAEKGYIFTDRDKSEFNRMIHKVDTIRGPGVTNVRDCITINPPQTPGRSIAGKSAGVVVVALSGITVTAGSSTGSALGIGYYSATILGSPSGAIDPTGTFTDAGTGGGNCYAINTYEQGSSRYLDTSGATVPISFAAIPWGVSSAATGSLPVYRLIGSIQGAPGCVTTTGGG